MTIEEFARLLTQRFAGRVFVSNISGRLHFVANEATAYSVSNQAFGGICMPLKSVHT